MIGVLFAVVVVVVVSVILIRKWPNKKQKEVELTSVVAKEDPTDCKS